MSLSNVSRTTEFLAVLRRLIVRAPSSVLIIMFASSLMSACSDDSGSRLSETGQNGSQNGDGLLTSESTPSVSPGSNGLPLSDGVASFVASSGEYWLDEDTALTGSLVAVPVVAAVSPQSSALDVSGRISTEQSDVAFQLLRQPVHGSLMLDINGQFTYVPAPDFFGDDSFEFYAWQKQQGSRPATVKIHVLPQPDVPDITANVISVVEQGAVYQVLFVGTDPDGDDLIFDAENLPGWLDFDVITGRLSGVPDQQDVGTHTDIMIGVSDSSGLHTGYPPFSVEVIDINDSPTINLSQFPTRLDARETVTVSVFPDDLDGDSVSVSTELNDFVDVTVKGGTLEVTAKDVTEVIDINLVVNAEDNQGSVSREVLPITLYPVTSSGVGRTLVGRKFGDGVHLVVLGDGYKADELAEYEQHVFQLIKLMQSDPAVNRHFTAWNIHTVPTPSIDSGIDDNVLEDYRQTEFNAGYYCSGIPRLICADDLHMFKTALAEYPHLDHIVLLVNDPRYGGSGGSVAIASVSSLEVALHELGHSVAHLADEYDDDSVDAGTYADFNEGEFANVSYRNTPDAVPWAHWIQETSQYPTQLGQPGIGIFEGGYYRSSGVYRPTSDSRMRSNESHFGPVNGEQWALSVYRIAHPVRDFGPTSEQIQREAGVELHFFVVPLFDESLQSVSWFLDGELVSTGVDPNTVDLLPTAGQHQLELRVEDSSGMIRKQPPHEGSFRWLWELTIQ